MKSRYLGGIRWVLLSSVLPLVACQSIGGSWYYQREPGRTLLPKECDHNARTCLHLSVINDSRNEYSVEEVRVFSQLPPGLPLREERTAYWTCNREPTFEDAAKAFELVPGRLIVLTLPHAGDAACMIPMDAELQVRGRKTPIRVHIAANQPNSIPTAWLGCPHSRPATQSGGNEADNRQTPAFPDRGGTTDGGEAPLPDSKGSNNAEYLPTPFKCEVN